MSYVDKAERQLIDLVDRIESGEREGCIRAVLRP